MGTFTISSGVRSNVTYEAAELVRDIVAEYGPTFTEEDLGVTQSFFEKSQARRLESLGAKLGTLNLIADYGLPYDFSAQFVEDVKSLTVEDIQALADELISVNGMYYVIVGDAETQMPRLSELGFGEPVLINEYVDALTE